MAKKKKTKRCVKKRNIILLIHLGRDGSGSGFHRSKKKYTRKKKHKQKENV